MIVSVSGFVREHTEVKIEGKMGQEDKPELEWDYNSTALKMIVVLCGTVAVAGIGILVFGSLKDSMLLLGFGLTLFIVGNYQLIAAMKEKANLDLLSTVASGLSRSAKVELANILVKHNAGASSGLLGLIESLFTKTK